MIINIIINIKSKTIYIIIFIIIYNIITFYNIILYNIFCSFILYFNYDTPTKIIIKKCKKVLFLLSDFT